MSLYETIGVIAGLGAIFTLDAFFPVYIPITLAGMAIGGGIAFVGSYVIKKFKHRTAKQQLEPAIEETQTLEDRIETPEFEEEEDGLEEKESPEPYAVQSNVRQDSKYEDKDTPTIIKGPKGWSAFGCPPKTTEDIYEYAIKFLSQNPELVLVRKGSLIDVEALDSEAEFYYSHDKNRIYVIGKKVPSVIENWEVHGAKYIVQDVPPPGSMQLETIVEGSLAGKCIYLKRPLPDTSAIMENSIDVMRYLQKGITLYLRKE